MNRLYEKLKDDTYFKDKLRWDEADNCLIIILHEYLCIKYWEGNYTACYDEGYMLYYTRTEGDSPMSSLSHCHIQDDDEALEAVIAYTTDDDIIYIENVKRFTWTPLVAMTKKRFEKKKAKYMAKKHLRIYSVNEIIKRSD